MFFFFVSTEKYFDMNKKQCKDGLDIYKRFLVRMEKVSEFLKVAEVSNPPVIVEFFFSGEIFIRRRICLVNRENLSMHIS